MNFITKLATTAVMATTVMFSGGPAQAGGCYPSLAGGVMNDALAGGASLKTAWNWAIQDGYSDGTERCWTMIKGQTRQWNLVRPYLYNAIFR